MRGIAQGTVYVVEACLVYLLASWIFSNLHRPIPPVPSKTFVVFVLLWPILSFLVRPGLRSIPILGLLFSFTDDLVAALAPVSVEARRQAKASGLLRKARRIEERRNLEKAIQLYSRIKLEFDGTPAAEEAAEAVAQAERLLKANREAEKLLKKAIKLEVRGQTAKAQALYQQILRDHPNTQFAADARSCLQSLNTRSQT